MDTPLGSSANPPSAGPPAPRQQAVGFAATKGPNGDWWVMVTHQSGTMSFTTGVPLDQADTYADDYAASIKATAAEARRERSGLIVAPSNGHKVDPTNRAARRGR